MHRQSLDSFDPAQPGLRPIFLAVDHSRHLQQLVELCRHQKIMLHLDLEPQLVEMREVQCMHYGYNETAFSELLAREVHRDGVQGEYVYFPWGAREIFNILPRRHFNENLTWRNKLKLTSDEQAALARVHVGIVGNSVGAFAAKLIAKMGVTKISVTDPKTLRPSNATRVYADSLRGYGRSKSQLLAESIFEYNPYIDLRVVPTGINDDNLEHFLRPKEGAPIDILVDAADDGDVKLLVREACRRHRLPRVSGYDERGVFLVERFDLDPPRNTPPIAVTREQMRHARDHAPQEYLQALLQFYPGGWQALSERQRQTSDAIFAGRCAGYAQLAWEAGLFGAMVAKGVVDVALGREYAGHWFVDLDEIFTGDPSQLSSRGGS